MYTVIIADDEPRIGELIKYLIHWSELDLSFFGISHDGTDLYAQIREKRPDIVITDVVMPCMTGLEIVRRTSEEQIPCSFIVVSGHRDFEFVQHAMKYGAFDYLLKPIDEDELNSTLKRLCDSLSAHREQVRIASIQQSEMQQNRQILQRHLIVNCFLSRTETFSALGQLNREYSTAFQPGSFRAMILAFEPSSDMDPVLLGRAEERALASAEERLRLQGSVTALSVVEHRLYILENRPAAHASEDSSDAALTAELRQQVNVLLPVSVTLGCGTWEQEFSGLPRSVDMAILAIRDRLRVGRNRVIGPDAFLPGGECAQRSLPLNRERLQQLAHIFDGMSQEKYSAWIGDICAQLGRACAGNVWYQICAQISRVWGEVVSAKGEAADAAALEREMLYLLERPEEFDPLHALREPVLTRMHTISREQQEQNIKPIRMARQYIEAHYMEAIGLEDVARYVYLHPAYLSHLFKETMGIGFSDYLANCRLERAKQLLTETNSTIYDIARQVGYSEPRAFSKFFLKNVGIKPTDYRRLHS